MKTEPFSKKTLWAGALKAEIWEYFLGGDRGELWTSVGGEVPHRFVGTLAQCELSAHLWLDLRKKEGFEEQLPSYNPASIN